MWTCTSLSCNRGGIQNSTMVLWCQISHTDYFTRKLKFQALLQGIIVESKKLKSPIQKHAFPETFQGTSMPVDGRLLQSLIYPINSKCWTSIMETIYCTYHPSHQCFTPYNLHTTNLNLWPITLNSNPPTSDERKYTFWTLKFHENPELC